MRNPCSGNEATPLLEDLKLAILSSAILRPSVPLERRTMFLSNIDQTLNFNIYTVHFFAANPEFPSEIVVEKLRSAVEQVLVPYDFLAGRLRLKEEEERLEIDCNSAGVEFLVAESNLKLDEIGELDYPNPAFRQLAAAGLAQNGLKMEDQSLCSFQLTFFKCGGFALGISNNHATFDGVSFKNFLQNLATLAAGELNTKLPSPPFTDRHLLSSRSPPRVTFPHPELVETPFFSSSILEPSPSNLNLKVLRLSAANISSLKLLSQPHATRPSSFNVVVAYLWRCKSASLLPEFPTEEYLKRTSMVLYSVDIRTKVSPHLPPEYAGNAVLLGYGAAAVDEVVVKGEFGKLVEAVAQGAERMNDDYVRSSIDWRTLYRGLPKGDMFVLSWCKLGFADVEYPWSKPVYTCHVVAHLQGNVISLLPSIGGVDKGVNVVVALPKEEMERFEEIFYKLLPSHE